MVRSGKYFTKVILPEMRKLFLKSRARTNKSSGLQLKRNKFTNFVTNKVMEDINRIKVVLVEKKRTNKWLAEQLGVNPSTVSKWCTNSSQPDLPRLLMIADLLEVNIRELIVREYKSYLLSQESK